MLARHEQALLASLEETDQVSRLLAPELRRFAADVFGDACSRLLASVEQSNTVTRTKIQNDLEARFLEQYYSWQMYTPACDKLASPELALHLCRSLGMDLAGLVFAHQCAQYGVEGAELSVDSVQQLPPAVASYLKKLLLLSRKDAVELSAFSKLLEDAAASSTMVYKVLDKKRLRVMTFAFKQDLLQRVKQVDLDKSERFSAAVRLLLLQTHGVPVLALAERFVPLLEPFLHADVYAAFSEDNMERVASCAVSKDCSALF